MRLALACWQPLGVRVARHQWSMLPWCHTGSTCDVGFGTRYPPSVSHTLQPAGRGGAGAPAPTIFTIAVAEGALPKGPHHTLVT
jgi:hypothetical protein